MESKLEKRDECDERCSHLTNPTKMMCEIDCKTKEKKDNCDEHCAHIPDTDYRRKNSCRKSCLGLSFTCQIHLDIY